MRARPPRRPFSTSLMFRLRLPKIVRELELACREAMDRRWEPSDRQRAQEIALALAASCKIEGLLEPNVVARSLSCLMKLSKEQILPIESAFREKIEEILGSIRATADQLLSESG